MHTHYSKHVYSTFVFLVRACLRWRSCCCISMHNITHAHTHTHGTSIYTMWCGVVAGGLYVRVHKTASKPINNLFIFERACRARNVETGVATTSMTTTTTTTTPPTVVHVVLQSRLRQQRRPALFTLHRYADRHFAARWRLRRHCGVGDGGQHKLNGNAIYRI